MPLYFYILPLHFSPCFVSPLSPRLRYLFLIRTYLFIFSFVPSCIKACRYYLKYNSVFTLSSTNHSSVLKVFLVIINHYRDELIEILTFTIAIIILRSLLSFATIIEPPKAIVVPSITIDRLRDSLSHLSLSPDILIADRMPLIFQRYEDLLSPLALQYLDTLNHYSERIVVSLDEDYLRTTYYCPHTDEILVASTSTFESNPLGQGIRTFRLKFYCDPIL